MNWLRVLGVLAAAVLAAGCTDDDLVVPDHAVVVEDGDLILSAWWEPIEGGTRFWGKVENTGDDNIPIRTGCGHPWQSNLTHNGTPVDFIAPEYCDAVWFGTLPAGRTMGYAYSWGHKQWQGDAFNATSRPAPQGTYQWTLAFATRDDTHIEALQNVEVLFPQDVRDASE